VFVKETFFQMLAKQSAYGKCLFAILNRVASP